MQVALVSIDTTSGEPEIDQLQIFPSREAAIERFIADYSPEGEYADIDAVGRDWDDLLESLKTTGTADTGEDRLYVLKEVDA